MLTEGGGQEAPVAKYQIEVTEVKEGGGCGSILLFCFIIFVLVSMFGK